MAIPGNRLRVAGATAEVKSRADFINTNESLDFNSLLEIPSKLGSTAIDAVSTAIDYDPTVVYDAMDNLNFTANISSTARDELSISTASAMSIANNNLGQSIGNKNMINLIFGDCPYDGSNLNFLFGLLLGLIPSLSSRQNCSNGLISMLINMFSGDTNPAMIANSLTGMVSNIKDGKGTQFLEDLNLNAEVLQMSGKIVDVNSSISNIVNKSDLSTSRDPDKAYATMTENMDFNNTIFEGNDKVTAVARNRGRNRSPVIPTDGNDVPKTIDWGDIISVKATTNSVNVFDSNEYI